MNLKKITVKVKYTSYVKDYQDDLIRKSNDSKGDGW